MCWFVPQGQLSFSPSFSRLRLCWFWLYQGPLYWRGTDLQCASDRADRRVGSSRGECRSCQNNFVMRRFDYECE